MFYDFFPFLLCVANVLLTYSTGKTFVELTIAVVVSGNVNLSVASVLDGCVYAWGTCSAEGMSVI